MKPLLLVTIFHLYRIQYTVGKKCVNRIILFGIEKR
jgi:hypothetical protein